MINMRMEKAILDTEMTVVRNEFEMGENSPERILDQRMLEAAYMLHNYGKSHHRQPLGYRACADRAAGGVLPEVLPAGQRDPRPSPASSTRPRRSAWIAETVRQDSRARRASWTRPTPRSRRRTASAPSRCAASAITRTIMVVYHGPAGAHPDAAALDVLTAVLGDVPSGRLYKALVDNKKAVGAGMDFDSLHDPGFIMAVGATAPGPVARRRARRFCSRRSRTLASRAAQQGRSGARQDAHPEEYRARADEFGDGRPRR